MSAILQVRKLSLGFGSATEAAHSPVVDAIDFDLHRGEILGIVGESGSGKSLTARAVMGLLPVGCRFLSGSINFEGRNLAALDEATLQCLRGKKIAMLFQDPLNSFNPLHRIGRQIGEGLAVHENRSAHRIKKQVAKLLVRVGLNDTRRIMEAFPHQLSGGQRQRAMLAMMLINQPDILIADEPTTALDAVIQQQVLELLGSLRDELSLSVLMISHDLAMVRSIADTICVMQQGKFVEQGKAHTVFTNPAHAYTKLLLARNQAAPPAAIAEKAPTVLTVRNLNVHYDGGNTLLPWTKNTGLHAVKNVGFNLRKGECLGIVGESGSGKSSVELAILRLIPSQGSISFMGKELHGMGEKQLRPLRHDIQIMFQDPLAALNPRLSVRDCIAEGLQAQRQFSSEEIEQQVVDAMLEVELEPDMRHRYPHEFSGGQCQRICLARALVLKPRCVVFDEPTSSLDRNTQFQVVDLLRKLQRQHGLASIFITHDLALVQSLCPRVMIMHDGKVLESGNTATIFAAPQHAYTRKLLQAAMPTS